jgi:choline-sulfatase
MSHPNILFIMSDQLIAALTGAYGHPLAHTPNLDRLAERGVRFDAAYTPFPLCAPGRACIATGRHASEIGAWDNGALLAADHPTYAHYLANAGYDTVASGKLHYVGPDQLHGLNRRLTTDIYSSDFGIMPEWIAIKEAQGRNPEAIMEQRRRYNTASYVGDAVQVGVWHNPLAYDEEAGFRACEYLRARGTSDVTDPFFLIASFHHPHEPFWPTALDWALYQDAEVEIPDYPADMEERGSVMDRWLNAYHGTERYSLRDRESLLRLRRGYLGQVTYVDRKVGELLEALEQSGLADSTVIVFTSDHGDMLGERAMVQKRCFYEWSCRVPLIIRFPDGSHAGTACATPVSLLDLLPTFCELAGAETLTPHDGHSLLSLLSGSEPGYPVFSQAHEAVGMPCLMVRRGAYKYTYVHGHDEQLFDVEADPDEWNNLAADPAHGALRDELRGLLLQRFDPDAMARENLASLHRRQEIRDTMRRHGQSWAHFPQFDARRSSVAQYLP